MYGFNSKSKAQTLSTFAGYLQTNPAQTDVELSKIIGNTNLVNDLRHRSYLAMAEVVEDIPAAYWDPLSGPNGRWIAGRGKVKIYQKYTETLEDPTPAQRENHVGVWNFCQSDSEDPPTITRDEVIRPCYNLTCNNYPSTVTGDPLLYEVWEDVHGTLWIERIQEFDAPLQHLLQMFFFWKDTIEECEVEIL